MGRLAVERLAPIIALLLVREGSKLPGFLVQKGVGVVLHNKSVLLLTWELKM
jgi:bile acid:Na+ symporter, BASS family